MAEDILQWLSLIPGVTPEKAQALKRAGYPTLDALRRTPTVEIAEVEGIGPILAQRIKNYLTWVEEEEDLEKGLLLCPECGAFISEGATECPHCGAGFEEGEEEAEPLELPEEAEPVLHMCPECGAFIAATAEVCTHCGAVFEVEPELPPAEEAVSEELPTSPCPLCGSLVADGQLACPNCGASIEAVQDDEIQRFLEELKEFERRAKKAAEEARPPERPEGPKGIVRDFLTRWERAQDERGPADLQQALEHYNRLLEVDPTLERVWAKRAEVLRQMGRDDEAMESLARAAELNPTKRREYKLQVMDILRTREDVSPLRPEWEPAAPREDEDAIALALHHYERLLEADPTLVRAWEVKAQLLESLGRSEEAVVALETAAELRRREGERRLVEVGRLEGEEVIPRRPALPVSRAEGGMINGLSAGKVNGLEAGRVNGLVNGLVNGTTMGRVNGVSVPSGRVNGLVNGTGLTNGRIDVFRPPIRPPDTRWILNSVGIASILFLMILAPLVLNVLFETEGAGIMIDGEFDDWSAVPAYSDAIMDIQDNPDVNLVSYKVRPDEDSLAVYAKVQGLILNGSGATGMDSFFVMMDKDGSEATGYRMGGLGVDAMVEVAGWNRSIYTAKEYTFDPEGSQDDWNAFLPAGSARVAIRGSEIELLTFAPESVRFLLVAADVAGKVDASDAVVGRPQGALTIHQTTTAPPVITSTQVPLLVLDVQPYGGSVTLRNLTAEVTGTYPTDSLTLTLLDENQVIIASASPVGRKVTFPVSMDIVTPRTLRVTASLGPLVPESSLGFRVSGAESNGTVSVRETSITSSYVLAAPEPTVDGAFADWDSVKVKGLSDGNDDVFSLRSPWVVNENIDLRGFRMHIGDNTSFYAEIDQAGRFLGGVDIPSLTMRPPPPSTKVRDSDGDTVPDIFEPANMTLDFNNDGIPDSSRPDDVDGDGIVDYPGGPDYWLNTTIPGWFPQDYRGRAVSVYVGPISTTPLEGIERLMIFIDADGALTGLQVASDGQIRGMDYLLLVEGRQGQVRSSGLYAYNGTAAIPWQFIRNVDAAVDSYRLEAGLDSAALPLKDDFAVLFRTMDWRGARDDADDVLGNATAGRGTRSAATNVVLNEISTRPNPEWVELANPTDSPVDLTGWELQRKQGNRWVTIYTFGSTTIGAWGSGNEYLVVDLSKNSLPNGRTTIRLVDANQTLVDDTTYPPLSDSESWSRYKDPDTGKPWDTDSDADWYISSNPTKGGANDLFIPEFYEIAVPLGVVLLFVLGTRRRRHRKTAATPH
jgi:ribosomal protein L40E